MNRIGYFGQCHRTGTCANSLTSVLIHEFPNFGINETFPIPI